MQHACATQGKVLTSSGSYSNFRERNLVQARCTTSSSYSGANRAVCMYAGKRNPLRSQQQSRSFTTSVRKERIIDVTMTVAIQKNLGEPQSAPVPTGKQIMVADTDAMRRLLVTWSKGCVGEHCGVPLSDGAVEELRTNYTNEQGLITEGDLEELAMMTSLVASKYDMLIVLFDLLDADKDMNLQEGDLGLLLKTVGYKLTPEEVSVMFAKGDFNRNGEIDFEEFCMMVRTETLDLAEVLAYIELTTGPMQMGVTRSARQMQAVSAQQQAVKKVWAEITTPKMALKETSSPSAAFKAADAKQELMDVVSPEVTATPESSENEFVPWVPGEYTMIHSGAHLQRHLDEHPEKSVCLMVGFTFCRPCKAFQRQYTKIAAHYKNVIFLFVHGNESEDTTSLVRDVLELKVSPMFYFFRDGKDGIVAKHEHSGARDYKLIDSLKGFLSKEEVPAEGHYVTQQSSSTTM